MSAQDELPPRWKWQVGPGITREELATMRLGSLNAAWWLAVERCAELEAELARRTRRSARRGHRKNQQGRGRR